MAYSKIILNGETLMDVTSDTVDAGNLLSGKTATKNSGAKITGNIASKSSSDLTASGATVTAPAGYYSTAASKAVTTTTHPNPTAAIASSTGVVTATHTQGTGYVTGGTTTGTLNLTTQAAQTINTSTADQTIASNRWLTGTQTIKSVTTSNLTAANIANGVTVKVGDANNASRISQVTGTYAPAVSSLTVTPTETAQTFNATGVYGYKPITVNAISSTYVGTGIARKSSADTTFTSTNGTFTAPIGYYSAAATKTLTTQAAQTIYPSTADQTIASYRWLTGTQTIRSVTTSNLTTSNIAEGIVVKVGDANDPSRISQVTGTYEPRQSYTATLMNNGKYDTMGDLYDYVSYNGGYYYSANNTFQFYPNDILECKLQAFNTTSLYVDVNGNTVYSSYASYKTYSYTLPNNNINITFKSSGTPYGMSINGASISINSNGIYDVADYGMASVNVPTGGDGGFTADEIAMRTISGDISGSATSIYSSAFQYCSALTTASFPNATSIGTYAFYNCRALTTISFPNVTNIGETAFRNCYSLTTASFPSAIGIGNYAFYTCSVLTTISFPNATSIGTYAFYSCSALTTASFSNVTSIGSYAFCNCSALTTASFPKVETIGGYMFRSCAALTTASFPNATSIGTYAFYNCSALTTANFPNVTSISSYAFGYCYSLITANFPKVITIGSNAFSHCSVLTTVSFPSVVSIFTSAFQYCYNLLSFYLLGSSVPTLGAGVFYLTPIDGYTTSTGGVYGSIFVPSSLYNQYIVATNWSDISARIVSV